MFKMLKIFFLQKVQTGNSPFYGTVSVQLLEKWRHLVSPKTLLCFTVRIRVTLGLAEIRFRGQFFAILCGRILRTAPFRN